MEKALLRRAAAGLLSPGVLARPKQHFPRSPDRQYARHVHGTLAGDAASPLAPLLDRPKLTALVRATQGRPELVRSLGFLPRLDRWMRLCGVRLA